MIGKVIKKGDVVYVYDTEGRFLSSRHVVPDAEIIGWASGTSYTVEEGDYMHDFDENSRMLESRLIPEMWRKSAREARNKKYEKYNW